MITHEFGIDTQEHPTHAESLGGITAREEIVYPYIMEPLSKDYRYLPLPEAYDFSSFLKQAQKIRNIPASQPIYVIKFWSKLKEDADKQEVALLNEHDLDAEAEANETKKLIIYKGNPTDENGVGLSFCAWDDLESALSLAKSEMHAKAKKMTYLYEKFTVSFYEVLLIDDEAKFRELRPDEINYAKHSSQDAPEA